MFDIKLQKQIAIALIASLSLLPFIISSDTIYPYIVGKVVFFRLIILALGIYTLLCVSLNGSVIRFNRLSMLWVVVMLSIILVSMVGLDYQLSYWATLERMNGLVQLCVVVLLACLIPMWLKSEKDWYQLLLIYLLVSIVFCVYTLLSTYSAGNLDFDNRLSGGWGNASYLAVYCALHLFIALALYIESRRSKTSIYFFGISAIVGISIAAFVVNTLCLVLAATYTVWLAAICGIIGACIIRRFVNRPVLLFVFVFSGFVLVNALLVCSADHLVEYIPNQRIESFSLRSKTWSIAQSAFFSSPWLGYGAETFLQVFAKYEPSINTSYESFDTAHNVFLDYLISYGVIVASFFIAAITYTLSCLIRTKSTLSNMFVGLAVFLLVYYVFWFESLASQWALALFIGYGIYDKDKGAVGQSDNRPKGKLLGMKHPFTFALLCFGSLFLFLAYTGVWQPYRAAKIGYTLQAQQIKLKVRHSCDVFWKRDNPYKSQLEALYLNNVTQNWRLFTKPERYITARWVAQCAINWGQSNHWREVSTQLKTVLTVLSTRTELLPVAQALMQKLKLLAPNRPDTVQAEGYLLLMLGQKKEAQALVSDYLLRNPVNKEFLGPLVSAIGK